MTAAQAYDLGLLDRWLSGGLCHGSGDGEKTVCVEQAGALCAGLPMTDHPDSCVSPAVSRFGVRLNDRMWSSPKARSAGLRAFAFAQLGTAGRLDEGRFAKRVAEGLIREIVPLTFRRIATMPRLSSHRGLEAAALRCETDGTAASAREAQKAAAADAAYAAAYAAAAYAAAYDDGAAAAAAAADAADADAADAYADGAAAAAAAADAADADAADAYAAAAAAGAAAAGAAAAAAGAAAAAAYAAADAAAAYAADAADAAAAAAGGDAARSRYRDEMFSRVADIAVRAIREQLGDETISPPIGQP